MFKHFEPGDVLFISIILMLIFGVAMGNIGWWIPVVLGTIYGTIVLIAYFRRERRSGQNSDDYPT